jgi:hypothetical protein
MDRRPTEVPPQILSYASSRARQDIGRTAANIAAAAGVLSFSPFLTWGLIECGVLPHNLWFVVRDDFLFTGSMLVGPVLGATAVLLSARYGYPKGAISMFQRVGRWSAFAALIGGTGLSLIGMAYAWPCCGMNLALWLLLIVVYQLRSPRSGYVGQDWRERLREADDGPV